MIPLFVIFDQCISWNGRVKLALEDQSLTRDLSNRPGRADSTNANRLGRNTYKVTKGTGCALGGEATGCSVTAPARRSRSELYEDIQDGLLRAVKNGRSTRILIGDLKKYLAALPAIEPKAKSAKVDAPFSEISKSPTSPAGKSDDCIKGQRQRQSGSPQNRHGFAPTLSLGTLFCAGHGH